jgi:hypothetical protein
LAWGHNFMALSSFFLDHVPGYNKFRTVTMTLVIAAFTFPLFGILTVNEILKGNIDKKLLQKYVLRSFYIVGGICFFFILSAGALFTFQSDGDQRYIEQGATEFINALQSDRLMLLRRDAFRSLLFIALGASLLYFYALDKLNKTYLIAGLGLIILMDMWGVDKRYLNNDNFVSQREYKNPIAKSKADEFILRDDDPDYRVLNLSVSPFQDATTSFYHKSIGGYHGAKMRRYQELIDFEIMPEIQMTIGALQKGSLQIADSALAQCNALNMLNTRYIIYNPESMPLINRNALGNAWFVSEVKWAQNANEEIALLNKIHPSNQVVINKEFTDELKEFIPVSDTGNSYIELTNYAPNKITYTSSADQEQLAVFSEIYYPRGWKVSVDGKPASYFRANYVLRAMLVPQGEHSIEFEFRPAAYYTGNTIAMASSGILLLLLLGTIFIEIKGLTQQKS